ncbi:MAG TPA: RNB domain-containing ribonuclease [Propionibacteriaceae bacterium]|nr:RNB domain-containing ribonuclease [Propionibacteriaceae bacterium]
MRTRHISLVPVPQPLVAGVERLRDGLDVPRGFPPEVLEVARRSAAEGPATRPGRRDLTDLDLVTIDPPGSMDLDQAVCVQRSRHGYRVWYAIADVAAWVAPGDAVDREAHRRGQTFYAPDSRSPLHPPVLGEGAASLLADGHPRPALVWRIDLDSSGQVTGSAVERASVRSRARLDYRHVQRDLDAGTARDSLRLLREVGLLRERVEAERGGVSLNLPEQEVRGEDGTWVAEFRRPLPVEGWNAQISLLTGTVAAGMMLAGGVGVLRTLPPAHPDDRAHLRHVAKSLHIPWPAGMPYPEFVRSLDPDVPEHLAMLTACTTLFRGAGYTVIGPGTDPDAVRHAALAADYAHATAPLRRLVDRYVGEVCVALCAGVSVPEWVLAALPKLPTEMAESDQRAHRFERGVLDLVEALELSGRVGDTFTGVVVEVEAGGRRGLVTVAQPAVEAPVSGSDSPLGEEIAVRLARCDTDTGRIGFAQA